MDFIRIAHIEQRLVGLTRLRNNGAKWIGVTRFATGDYATKLVTPIRFAFFFPIGVRPSRRCSVWATRIESIGRRPRILVLLGASV